MTIIKDSRDRTARRSWGHGSKQLRKISEYTVVNLFRDGDRVRDGGGDPWGVRRLVPTAVPHPSNRNGGACWGPRSLAIFTAAIKQAPTTTALPPLGFAGFGCFARGARDSTS